MSKLIWRMHSKYNMMYGIQASEPDLTDKANCTLIPDESNFPVKEAMRVVKAAVAWYRTEDAKEQRRAELHICIAMGKYDCAVERMKAKHKKGKK